jgi:alpha-glucosidase
MQPRQIDQRTLWIRSGTPLSTESLLFDREAAIKLTAMPSIPFEIIEGESVMQLRMKIEADTRIFGLGVNLRGMDKRGGLYESFCTDDPVHTPGKKSLYGAHNFILVSGQSPCGLFIDFPGKVVFDVGFTYRDEIMITINGTDVDLYIFQNGSLKELTAAFRNLMGETYAPPKWAFGFQQSRWSYQNRQEVEMVASSFEKHRIPCDAIYLDIDYMEQYKIFTIDESRFPDFEGFVTNLKKRGFRLIPIIDPGVKIEKNYSVYEEGITQGYFCRDEEQEIFTAAVWPGTVHFPDFLNAEARRWFGLKYRFLTDLGIEGFWNDMNEPSIFYTKDRLKAALSVAKDSEEMNLDIHTFFQLTDTFKNLFNHPDDYRKMIHDINGTVTNHETVHNLYGFNMTKAAAEGLREIDPDKRFLLFSRSSAIGMGRFGGIWTGDNHSWWEHILLSIQMMPAINQCGFLYTGADTGGFGGNANAQLVIRWSQFSLFTPLFRNHSAMNTRHQEPYAFEADTTEIMRKVIELRYALIPYLYSEFMKAVRTNGLYFMPLCFEYSDEASGWTDDQLLIGESVMAAPVYKENASGRYVYLPEQMLLWKAVRHDEIKLQVMDAGHHFIKFALDETPLFIRKNRMLVLGKPAMNVEEMDLSVLTVIAFVEDWAVYDYYDDDGASNDFQKGVFSELHFGVKRKETGFDVTVENRGNPTVKTLRFIIMNTEGGQESFEVKVD